MTVDSVLKIERELTEEVDSDIKYSFERRGNTTVKVYSYEFSQEYHKRMNGMVERRLRAAILAVGSIWHTAWGDAGQPDLSKLQNTPPSEALLEDMKSIDEMFQSGIHKGRICD